MDRRTFLRSGACIAGATSLGGCLDFLDAGGSRVPPLVEDRPDAVYYPSHIEGMQMADTGTAGPYRVGVTYSFPHRFWLITGRERKLVEIREADSVHLMATVWDEQTDTVVPASDVSIDVTIDGEPVASKGMWPMLSQNMGLHYGDNVALEGSGTYEVTVTVGPVGARRTGAFADEFGRSASTTLEFEFDHGALGEVMFRPLEEKKGERGAVSPMEMEMLPVSQLHERAALPGSGLGEATSGDGRFVATALGDPPAGIEAAGTYLAVSARTPYNRYPLTMMSLSGTLERGAETVFDGPLRPTLDPDLGYHYGAVVDSVEAGDDISLSIGVPPQVARHEGYEMAFFEMDPMRLTV